jgi:hypothetical protein
MMEQFTRQDLYSAFDAVYSNLRFIRLYLQDAAKTARKDGFNLQVESIQEDLAALEEIDAALVNLENNY